MQKTLLSDPVIAIVGRPNVGKSTLFNLLAGKALAIVHDQPGVTRDRREARTSIHNHSVLLVDTAGYENAKKDQDLALKMQGQMEFALKHADIILFMIDGRKELTSLDYIFAKKLYKIKKPVILIVNKCENDRIKREASDIYRLGFKKQFMISSAHNLGVHELCEYLENEILNPIYQNQKHKQGKDQKTEEPPLRIAVVGRPNVGKSTLINRLINQDRLITGDEAGITRDSIAVEWSWKNHIIRLVDTAGLRKKSRVYDQVEKYSVEDSLRAIRLAEIVILVIDSTQAFEKQDLFIMSRIIHEGRGLVFACTKWDKIIHKSEMLEKLKITAEKFTPQARKSPLIPLSGLTGDHIDRLMPALMTAWSNWNAMIKTSDLNQWLEYVTERKLPVMVKGFRSKLKYISQIKARPPSFVIKGSRLDTLQESYKRYLLRELIDGFHLEGASPRLILRSNDNPYKP